MTLLVLNNRGPDVYPIFSFEKLNYQEIISK